MPEGDSTHHVVAMFSHAKAEADFLDQLDGDAKDAMQDYIENHLTPRMDALKAMFGGNDDELGAACKAFEDEHDKGCCGGKGMEANVDEAGVDGPTSTGESQLIGQGNIPETPDDDEAMADFRDGRAEKETAVDDMIDAEEDVQAENDMRQNVVPKSFEDSPADPAIVAEYLKLLRTIEMEKVFGPQSNGNGSPGMGVMRHLIGGQDPYLRPR